MESDTNIEQEKFQTKGVILASTAHGMHDTYTGFLPALLPLLIQKFSLTNTSAGLLSLFMQLPSLFQPLLGQLADRKNLRILVILGPALTGAAMSLLGIAPSYGFLIFLLILAGLSSASLHTVGPVIMSRLAGKKLGKGVSFWMVGGEFGRSMGPVIVASVVSYLTLERLPWMMLGGIFTSILLYIKLRSLVLQPPKNVNGTNWKIILPKLRKVMIPLAFILFTRSLMSATMNVFLPTFLTNEGSTLLMAGASLSILQAAGVLGTLLSGPLSDRIGRRKVLAVSLSATPVFMFLFLQSSGIWQIPFLLLMGFFGISIIPVILAIVLENFPDNRSLANGIYMAIHLLLNSLGVLLVGKLGDLLGLRPTFLVSLALIPLGLPFVFFLPKSKHQKA